MIRSFGEKTSCDYIAGISGPCVRRWTTWWLEIDWRKLFHPLKGGLVLGMVSCVLLSKDVYNALGKNVIWAILTVVVVFESTVGRFHYNFSHVVAHVYIYEKKNYTQTLLQMLLILQQL